MGESEIPHLNLDFEGGGAPVLGNEGARKALGVEVREACEAQGCFVLNCSETSKNLHQKMLMGMKALFDLPLEAKARFTKPKTYQGYIAHPQLPLHESFGIQDAHLPQVVRDFTSLMWPPHGNPSFWLHAKDSSSSTSTSCIGGSFRLIKYKVGGINNKDTLSISDSTKTNHIALVPHADTTFLTLLSQNEVQGLEILSKNGGNNNWIPVVIPEGSFVVIVGELLQAWSNGRLLAPKHRVVMKGDKERYSYGSFLAPEEEMTIQVPPELVDDDHPLCYRPFLYSDYLSFYASNSKGQALDAFAAV